jgi:hypothetical protein
MSIQQLIDEELAKKEPRVRSGKYSPSSFGRCYRLQYWNRKDEPKTNLPDERTERVFKAGNLFHEFVQGIILKNQPTAEKEVLVEDDDFKGYADLVIGDEVTDIKSQHSGAFWYRDKKTWAEIEPQIKHHILQVVFYAYKLSKLSARIIYISKDDCCIQEYSFPTEKYLAEIEKEITDLKTIWAKQELPPALPRAYGVDKKTGKPKDCNYCSWKDLCEKTEKK